MAWLSVVLDTCRRVWEASVFRAAGCSAALGLIFSLGVSTCAATVPRQPGSCVSIAAAGTTPWGPAGRASRGSDAALLYCGHLGEHLFNTACSQTGWWQARQDILPGQHVHCLAHLELKEGWRLARGLNSECFFHCRELTCLLVQKGALVLGHRRALQGWAVPAHSRLLGQHPELSRAEPSPRALPALQREPGALRAVPHRQRARAAGVPSEGAPHREELLAALAPQLSGHGWPRTERSRSAQGPARLPGTAGRSRPPPERALPPLCRARCWPRTQLTLCCTPAHGRVSLCSLPASSSLESMPGLSFVLLKNRWVLGVGLPVTGTESLAASPCQTATSETCFRKTGALPSSSIFIFALLK